MEKPTVLGMKSRVRAKLKLLDNSSRITGIIIIANEISQGNIWQSTGII